MTMKQLNSGLHVIVIFLIVMTILELGPKIEGRFFPVVTKFEFTKITKNSDGSTTVEGVLIKSRDCDPVVDSITVFSEDFINDGTHPSKQIDLIGGVVVRTQGSQYFGPWTLIPPEPPLGPSFVIHMKHDCHIFWNIDTVLFSGLTEDFFRLYQIVQRSEDYETQFPTVD